MITLILGSIGSGKSYEGVVWYVLPAIEQGRKIITNLPLQIDKLEKKFPGCGDLIELRTPVEGSLFPFQSPSDYGDTWRHKTSGAGPIYIIDEAHEPLPRIRRKDPDREAVEMWFAKSRHETADVVLISQTHRKINANIVDLAQNVIRVRKNTAIGSKSTYRRLIFDGLGGEQIGGVTIRRYSKQYFPLYQSYTGDGGVEQDNTGVKIRPLLLHPIFLMFYILFAYVGYQLIFGGASLNPIEQAVKQTKKTDIPQASDLESRFKPSKQINRIADNQASETEPEVETEIKIETKPLPPLARFKINLVGWYDFGSERKFLFDIWDGPNKRHQYTQKEILSLGYEYQPIDGCSGYLKFGKKNELVMCGSPSSRAAVQSGTIQNFAQSVKLK